MRYIRNKTQEVGYNVSDRIILDASENNGRVLSCKLDEDGLKAAVIYSIYYEMIRKIIKYDIYRRVVVNKSLNIFRHFRDKFCFITINMLLFMVHIYESAHLFLCFILCLAGKKGP